MSQTNPFSETDADRHAIWEALVRRDIEAFIRSDWPHTGQDFHAEGFFGIDAAKNRDPDEWSLKYPSLDAYRDEWLRQAEDFQQVKLANEDKLAFIFRSTRMDEIDIKGNRAFIRKRFDGETRAVDGSLIALHWQSLFLASKINGIWKIAGFVGYLPYPFKK